jgi:hypothetical protein
MSEPLHIEVGYATPDRQFLITVELPAPATAAAAVHASGITQQCPELDGASLNVGIFGRMVSLTQPLKDGDRVEIYRPLYHDPKEARRQRAAK